MSIGMNIYLIAGIMFEALVQWVYVKENIQCNKVELWIGAAIDVIAWPIVIIVNCIRLSR